ncbi:MAG: hypothetical protein QM655_04235 [Nocardioidaceae bacterium]
MTQDAVAATKASIDSLSAATARLAHEYGETLGVRRLLSDVSRLKDDLAELGDPKPGHRPPGDAEVVVIDDRPYDDSLWEDGDSEAQHAQ